jgi:hypothetical protein
MKARDVTGLLHPDGPLVENMRRVILVRLDELYGFVPAALDPSEVEAAHDMRIAAKRLRYLLELSEPLYGKDAKRAAKVVKGLQDVLGEVHDCDELIEVAATRGLDELVEHTRERRLVLHEAFTREWETLEKDGFRGFVEAALEPDQPREGT